MYDEISFIKMCVVYDEIVTVYTIKLIIENECKLKTCNLYA